MFVSKEAIREAVSRLDGGKLVSYKNSKNVEVCLVVSGSKKFEIPLAKVKELLNDKEEPVIDNFENAGTF